MERPTDAFPLVDLDTLDDRRTQRLTAGLAENGARKRGYDLIANSSGKGGG